MDRDRLQAIISTAAGLVDDEPLVVRLACIDDAIVLQPLSKVALTRLGVVYTKGDAADVEADVLIAVLKYAALSDDGTPLFRSIDEAAAFLNYVGDHSDEDLVKLVNALGELAARHTRRLVKDVDEGKGS